MEKMMTRSCPPCLVRCFQIKIKFGKKRKQRLLQARKKNFKKASTMIKSVQCNTIFSHRQQQINHWLDLLSPLKRTGSFQSTLDFDRSPVTRLLYMYSRY